MFPKSAEFYRRLPKIELHRHLEGSLRLQTILEIAKTHELDFPVDDVTAMSSLVQIQPGEPCTVANFLSKFAALRQMYKSPEIIRRITMEAVEDAAADNIRHLELRFTPVALSKNAGFPMADVIDWVCESALEASQKYQVSTVLLASVNRHESWQLAEQVARLASDKMSQGIGGLDLAGDESAHGGEDFIGVFREARQAGLKLTVHAGEWAGAENVLEAIEVFEADRIGHGVRIVENPKVVEIARERRVVFEVCPTSNVQSGAVSGLEDYPLALMMRAGLLATINSDDPGISDIELADEYKLALEALDIGFRELRESVITAAKSSFLPEEARFTLAHSVSQDYAVI